MGAFRVERARHSSIVAETRSGRNRRSGHAPQGRTGSERGETRTDDRVTEVAMEDCKRGGLLLSATDQAVAR